MNEDRLLLSALLSQALVAFTIEFDNESEHRMPHSTTNHGRTPGALHAPWLVSVAMWFNCLQFIGEEGIQVKELERLASSKTNLNGMQRWGYIFITSSRIVHVTSAGRKAQEILRPLFADIGERWEKRFGKSEVDLLRETLSGMISKLDIKLPDYLPILGYGLYTLVKSEKRPDTTAGALPTLLSKLLIAFALEFESASDVSLAICANVLRHFAHEPIRLRNLPKLSGVSKESIAMALTFLEKRGYAITRPESQESRVKVLELTAKGELARDMYAGRISSIESHWHTRFGENTIATLRTALEHLQPNLFKCLEPYPDGWRAKIPKPEVLPHYPMVLHRGGFPDGS